MKYIFTNGHILDGTKDMKVLDGHSVLVEDDKITGIVKGNTVPDGFKEINPRQLSPLVLAYIGDAVFEIIARTLTVSNGNAPVNVLCRGLLICMFILQAMESHRKSREILKRLLSCLWEQHFQGL